MNNQEYMNKKLSTLIYTTEDGLAKIKTTFDSETVWLSIRATNILKEYMRKGFALDDE